MHVHTSYVWAYLCNGAHGEVREQLLGSLFSPSTFLSFQRLNLGLQVCTASTFTHPSVLLGPKKGYILFFEKTCLFLSYVYECLLFRCVYAPHECNAHGSQKGASYLLELKLQMTMSCNRSVGIEPGFSVRGVSTVSHLSSPKLHCLGIFL